MVQTIRVNTGLSSVESETTNFLSNSTNRTTSGRIDIATTGGVLINVATSVVPRRERHIRDKRTLVEDVHLDVTVGVGDGVTREDRVSDHETLHLLVSGVRGVGEDLSGKGRDVDTTITLTSQPSVTTDVLGVSLQKSFDEVSVVHGGLLVIGLVLALIIGSLPRETNSTGLLQVDNIGSSVPGKLSELNVSIFVHTERTMFSEQTAQTRATRTTLVPKDQRISFRGLALTLNHPVEEVTLTSDVGNNITGVRLEGEGSGADITGESLSGDFVRATEGAFSVLGGDSEGEGCQEGKGGEEEPHFLTNEEQGEVGKQKEKKKKERKKGLAKRPRIEREF